MRGRKSQPYAKPKKPETVKDALPALRKYMVGLFERDEAKAADWHLIAETLFRSAFAALAEIPADDKTLKMLGRVHAGAYERLVVGLDAAPKAAADGQAVAPMPPAQAPTYDHGLEL